MVLTTKNGPHLSCNLHKMGSNIYSKLAVAPFLCKKVWLWMGGWIDGWVGGRAGLRIAYSIQKLLFRQGGGGQGARQYPVVREVIYEGSLRLRVKSHKI